MSQALLCRQPSSRIDRQTPADEILGFIADILPILRWIKSIIPRHNSLHFFHRGVTVEGRISAEEEVRDNAQGPDVDGLTVTRFLEDFRGHVAWCSASGGEDVEGFFIDDAGEAKVCDEEVRVFCWSTEK